MTPLFASIQFGRNRSPLQEKSIIAMMFENTLRCTGRSLFMQLPIFPLLTAVRRRANEYCALTLNIFFSPDLERVTFFQHLAQIYDRGVCSNPIGNFVLVTKLSKTTSNRCQQNPGNFKQTTQLSTFFFTNTITPEAAVRHSLSNGNIIAVGSRSVSKIDIFLMIEVTRFRRLLRLLC